MKKITKNFKKPSSSEEAVRAKVCVGSLTPVQVTAEMHTNTNKHTTQW